MIPIPMRHQYLLMIYSITFHNMIDICVTACCSIPCRIRSAAHASTEPPCWQHSIRSWSGNTSQQVHTLVSSHLQGIIVLHIVAHMHRVDQGACRSQPAMH